MIARLIGLLQVPQALPGKDELHAPPYVTVPRRERYDTLRTVAELLLRLWAVPDDWLGRLRVCRALDCGKFFLDETSNQIAQTCSDRCRTAKSRLKKK